mmetsp:Transcript_39481/g.70846  ORF Transcript_39481/g.70846 Transcript_39481/m.70846 type:complete len:89 (-) Transcript_39481:45-311(-)
MIIPVRAQQGVAARKKITRTPQDGSVPQIAGPNSIQQAVVVLAMQCEGTARRCCQKKDHQKATGLHLSSHMAGPNNIQHAAVVLATHR